MHYFYNNEICSGNFWATSRVSGLWRFATAPLLDSPLMGFQKWTAKMDGPKWTCQSGCPKVDDQKWTNQSGRTKVDGQRPWRSTFSIKTIYGEILENLTSKNVRPYLSPYLWIIPISVCDPVFEVFRKNKFFTASHFRFLCCSTCFDQFLLIPTPVFTWTACRYGEIMEISPEFCFSGGILEIRWALGILCNLWSLLWWWLWWCNISCFTPNIKTIITISFKMHDEHDRAPWIDIKLTFRS